jgi:hypothetical protein
MMNLYITGFLVDDSVDSSLKFDLDIASQFEDYIMAVLGWASLEEESDGDLPLSRDQVNQISMIIGEQLPIDMDLFIGVVA